MTDNYAASTNKQSCSGFQSETYVKTPTCSISAMLHLSFNGFQRQDQKMQQKEFSLDSSNSKDSKYLLIELNKSLINMINT